MDLGIFASAFSVRRRFGPSLGLEWLCLGRPQVHFPRQPISGSGGIGFQGRVSQHPVVYG